MECSIRYSSKKYKDVILGLRRIKNRNDKLKWLIQNYGEVDGNTIFNAINEGIFTPDWDIDNYIDNQRRVEEAPKQLIGRDFEDRLANIKSAYSVLGGSDFQEIKNEFSRAIVKACIFNSESGELYNNSTIDKSTGISKLNKNILDYKLNLMRNIASALGMDASSISYPFDLDLERAEKDAIFTDLRDSILSEFDKQSRFGTNDQKLKTKEVINDFIKLKYFDQLLADYGKLVSIKDKYKSGTNEGAEMYEINPVYVDQDHSFTSSESADIDRYSSKFVKLLLNYFTYTDKLGKKQPIGFVGFILSMNKLIDYVKQNPDGIAKIDDLWYNVNRSNISADGNDLCKIIDYLLASKTFYLSVDEKARLSAIKDQIFKSKDERILNMFSHLVNDQAKYKYIAYRRTWNYKKNRNEIKKVLLQQQMIDRYTVRTRGAAMQSINYWNSSNFERKQLFDKYGIQPIVLNDSKNEAFITINNLGGRSVTIKALFINNNSGKNYWIYEQQSDNGAVINPSDNDVKQFIEEVFKLPIDDNYNEITGQIQPGATLWTLFRNMIATELLAISENDNIKDTFITESGLNLNSQISDFNDPGKFITAMYGIEDMAYLVNGKGSKMPAINLSSSIYDVQKMIWNAKHNNDINGENVDSVFGRKIKSEKDYDFWKSNPLAVNKNILGDIYVRSDTKTNSTKSQTEIGVSEWMQQTLFYDFLSNLKESGNITLQPIVYSDKRTHFMVEFLTSKYNLLSGKHQSLDSVLKGIYAQDSKTRVNSVNAIRDEIKFVRSKKSTSQILNVLKRMSLMFGLNEDYTSLSEIDSNSELSTSDYNFIDNHINTIESELQKLYFDSNFKKSVVISKLRDLANNAGVNFEEALDIVILKNDKPRLNELIKYNFRTYANSDNSNYTRRLVREQKNFVKSLLDSGFVVDVSLDPGLDVFINTAIKIDPRWGDLQQGTMELAYAQKGNDVQKLTRTNFDDLINDGYEIVLNPLLESYYYAQIHLGNSFNDIVFGDVAGVENKYNGKTLSDIDAITDPIEKQKALDLFYLNNEASRTTALFKRTVIGGATRHSLHQGMEFGVAQTIRIAAIDDLEGNVFNLVGWTSDEKALDGAGFTNPYYSRMENESFLDSAVNSTKKTIYNYVDPEIGQLRELKWAEYEITNQMRRWSYESEFSADIMFKKMLDGELSYSDFWDDNETVDLNKFYNPTGNEVYSSKKNAPHHKISYNNYLYRYDPETDKTYRLERLESESFIDELGNSRLRVNAVWRNSDDNGNVSGNEFTTSHDIGTLYDLDQVFGGAFVKQLNNGKLEWSEGQNDIIYNIICEQDLKDRMIAYSVQHSAFKVGFANGNQVNSFSSVDNPNNSLRTIQMSTKYGGIQMDADREIDESEVTEMSQMISALIQNGEHADRARAIYNWIGLVIKQNIDGLKLDNNESIYALLGKALVDSFSAGDKSVMGLAQSFIANANRALQNGDFSQRIPFSAQSIKSQFQAIVTSLLNKTGVRRKFAGIGNVANPSRGLAQIYAIPNGDYGTYTDLIKYLANYKRDNGIISSNHDLIHNRTVQLSNGQIIKNPFISDVLGPLAIQRLKLGDTIYITDTLNEIKEEKLTINSLADYDRVKNWIDQSRFEIRQHTIAPRELQQAWSTFNINQNNYSVYDLDESRALYYLELGDKASGEMKSFVDLTLLKYDDFIPGEHNKVEFLKAKQQAIFRQLQEARKGNPNISITVNGNSGVVSNVNVEPAQIITSRLNGEKIGLDNTSLYEILNNPNGSLGYFKDRVNNLYKTFDIKTTNRDIYKAIDYQLISKDGSQVFAVIDNDDNRQFIDGLKNNYDYELMRDGHIYHNGEDFTDINVNSKRFKKYSDGKGNIYDIIVIDSIEDLNDLLDLDDFMFHRTVYSEENLLRLLGDAEFFNVDGLTELGKIRADIEQTDRGYKSVPIGDMYHSINDLYFVLNSDANQTSKAIAIRALDAIIDNLNKREIDAINKAKIRLAEDWNTAFEVTRNHELTRIPSQSLQSTTSARIVAFSDNNINDSYKPLNIMTIMGSDLDIDEDWQMTYETNKNGKVVTLSNLDKKYDVFDVLLLPPPTGRIFTVSTDGKTVAELIGFDSTLTTPINVIAKIIESGETNLNLRDDESWILEDLNTHENTKRSSRQKEAGLKNHIVRSIMDITSSIATINSVMNPISMDQAKNAAKKSALGKSEQLMTMDNPAVIPIMQMQNMQGKDVIGIGASALKAYFAICSYANGVVDRASKLVDFNDIINELSKIALINPLTNDLTVYSNINFKKLFDRFRNVGLVRYDSAKLSLISKQKFAKYISDNGFNFGQLLIDMNDKSNGNAITEYINAADVYSCIISMATDNAKELLLQKLNATKTTANVYTYLAGIGYDINAVADLMVTPIVNETIRFAESNVFDDATSWFKFEDAINFMLGTGTLSVMNSYKFNKIIFGEGIDDGFIYDLYFKNKPIIDQTTGNVLFEGSLRDDVDPIRIALNSTVKTAREAIDEIKKIKSSFRKNEDLSDKYNKLLFNNDVANLMLKYTENWLANNHSSELNVAPDEILEDPEFAETRVFNYDLSAEDFIRASSFIRNYIFARNEVLSNLEVRKDLHKLEEIKSLLPYIEEVRILSNMLSVNQGLRTGGYEEYNWIKRIENFVNKRFEDKYINQRFDLIQFIDDSEYRERMIKAYDGVMSGLNILDVICHTDNFWGMLNQVSTNRKLIHESALINLEHQMADKILEISNPKNWLTKKINTNEYKELQRFVNDNVIKTFLTTQEFKLNIQPNQYYFSINGKTPIQNKGNKLTKVIQSQEELATFKYLMETYVIPELKTKIPDNRFIKDLISGFEYDKATALPVSNYKLPISLADADKSTKAKILYGEYLQGFNAISRQSLSKYGMSDLIDGLTIGDLFYMYNLLTYKDSIGNGSFTKIFEDLNVNDYFSLVRNYYDFISALDSKDIKLDQTKVRGPIVQFGNTSESGDFNPIISMNVDDYLYRIASQGDSSFKFKTTVNRGKRGNIESIQRGNSRIKNPGLNPSYFTLQLPNVGINKVEIGDLGENFKAHRDLITDYNINSSEVFTSIINHLRNLFGDKVPIKIVNDSRLVNMWRTDSEIEFEDEDDLNRTRNAMAFIHNGIIYINESVAKRVGNVEGTNDSLGILEAPIHELLHIACAALKYGTDANKNLYYKALDVMMKNYPELYSEAQTMYGGFLSGSDVQEEALVKFFAMQLADEFAAKYGGTRTNIKYSDMNKAVIDILNDILVPEKRFTMREINKMRSFRLSDFLVGFRSKLINLEPKTDLQNKLIWNQRLARIKNQMIKDGSIELNDCR